MRIKKYFDFLLSILILVCSIAVLILFFLISSSLIDMVSEPSIKSETNTSGVPAINASNHSSINGTELEMKIFNKVNEFRRNHEKNPFTHSERVRLIARLHSAEMGKRGYFDHTNPEGIAPPERHNQYKGCKNPNENIAMLKEPQVIDTRKIATQVVSMWANSSGHNTTMMSGYYYVSAVGVYVTENRSIYVTQNFCREHPNA
jgi:uncharacterized protein YkwD